MNLKVDLNLRYIWGISKAEPIPEYFMVGKKLILLQRKRKAK